MATRPRGAFFYAPSWVQVARGAVCTLLLVVITAAALDAALVPRMTRNGFTSAASAIAPGRHIATGWSVGFPIGGERQLVGRDARLTDSYWAKIFLAGPPPAPGLMTPILLLPGTTGSFDNADVPLTLTGTKPPNSVNYPFYALVYAATNGVPLPNGQITQVQEYNQWSLAMPLDLDARVELTLMSSNMFGLSSAPTVVTITQIPEPVGFALLGLIMITRVYTRARRCA